MRFFKNVDVQFLAQIYEEDENVGQFLSNRFTGLRVEVPGLTGILPKEIFEKFRGFDNQTLGEIFRIVKLSPVPPIAEVENLPP